MVMPLKNKNPITILTIMFAFSLLFLFFSGFLQFPSPTLSSSVQNNSINSEPDPFTDLLGAFKKWDSQVGCSRFRDKYQNWAGNGSGSLQSNGYDGGVIGCGEELKLKHVSVLVKGWTWIPDNMENLYYCRCGLSCLWTKSSVLADHPDALLFETTTPPFQRRLGGPLRIYMDLEAGRKRSGREDIFVSYHAKDDVQATYAGALFHNNRNYDVSSRKQNLLGKDCYDIDIAIDNMLGREFCEKINEYLSQTGQDVQGIGVIQCNPDQSKHLETARMRLYDLWVDFVNLRAEDYSESSRIPTMRFGTAKEDAFRRDLTINSLFYNINTNSVEDFTESGIEDLKSGRIVTPLPPKETFLDDPLRVLRAIRFGARFSFVLDEYLKEAAASDEVRAAVKDKISRERIGHEIDLMVGGNQPVKAMTYVCDLQLFWVVFSLPSNVDPPAPEACDRVCLAYIDEGRNLIQSLEALSLDDEQRRLCLYAALFLPLRSTIYRDKKNRKVPAVDFIFRSSLKLKAKDAETVISIHRAAEKFVSLIPCISSEDVQSAEAQCGKIEIDVPENSKLRILIGLVLREIKDFWQVALLVSTLLYPSADELKSSDAEVVGSEKRKEMFKLVKDAIVKLGLETVWEAKPLVNGKEIMDVLNIQRGGPEVKIWQQKVIEWQLAHPAGTANECLEWLRESGAKRAKR